MVKISTSQIVATSHMLTDEYYFWCSEIDEPPKLHRKQWEYYFILKVLKDNNMLQEGKHGIGFGVGKEPLPSTMAKYKVSTLVSDMDNDSAVEKGWMETGEFSTSVDDMHRKNICSRECFNHYVKTRIIDMNDIPNDIGPVYDFTWSSCAFEHLGNLEKGLQFVRNSLDVLKPGGIAIHTTEYNVSSNTETMDEGPSVLYRKCDLESFVDTIRSEGFIVHIDFDVKEDHPLDKHIDLPPYSDNEHLKLLFDGFVTTSIGLVIYKPEFVNI